ncbi:hypothetical protein [Sphingopyxis sp. QXT-31]|uniref:hypothetical protein n=1 Tax=Sphingopyxis sp. QXT-31 TaxID=1357916 RepID=UPI0012EC5206|nr:hypothetical protein [Sphingopyxis sp. QXT-31]
MPYRSPEWARQDIRERAIEALNQLRGNRQMAGKVPYSDYLDAMNERLSDFLDSDGYASDELKAISEVRNALIPLLDLRSKHPSHDAIEALQTVADRAFSLVAGGDRLTNE